MGSLIINISTYQGSLLVIVPKDIDWKDWITSIPKTGFLKISEER